MKMKDSTGKKNSEKGFIPILSMVILVLLVLAISLFPPFSKFNPFLRDNRGREPELAENGDYYEINHEWNYKGYTWTYDSQVPESVYQRYKSKPRTDTYGEYVTNSEDDEWITDLAEKFREASNEKNFNSFETVGFVLSFVQNMEYTSDKVTSGFDEYPRYPIETLVWKGGDCEDTSILFSSILKAMDYGTVLLVLEGEDHMAAGVQISQDLIDSWKQSYPLSYYRHGENRYAYCETTSGGWRLGEMPSKYESTDARVIEVA